MRKRDKKCPAVEFFGVAQSPKSSSSGTIKIIHRRWGLASAFQSKMNVFSKFMVFVKQLPLKNCPIATPFRRITSTETTGEPM
jgi:hypothetical protein